MGKEIKKHTVLVVGAGPSGSAAAYTLAKKGIDVCVVDKTVFPREKLCGGLLTQRSEKVFKKVFGDTGKWGNAFEFQSRGAIFIGSGKILGKVEDYSDNYFTNRFHFDDYLFQLGKEIGVTSYEGEAILAIDFEKKTCTLRSGVILSYEFLIGADGVNSFVAKSLYGNPLDMNKIGFALEVEIDRDKINRKVELPEIYLDSVNWGYGWVFPKEKTVTVGLGAIHSKNKDLKSLFYSFVKESLGEIDIPKLKGHYIPFGDYRKKPGKGNVLLVGDAAGLVDPITGEGIALAMESGFLAAEAIRETIDNSSERSAIEIYTQKIKKIHTELKYANNLRYLVFHEKCKPLFLKILPKTKRVPKKHLDLMAHEISYPFYVKFLIKSGLRNLPKVFSKGKSSL